MSDTIDAPASGMPSAAPTEADIAAWNDLPRDEQLRRLRLALEHPDCSTVSTSSMSEILERAQAKGQSGHG